MKDVIIIIDIPSNFGEDKNLYIPGKLESIANPNNLHDAYIKSKNGVQWKESIQKFRINELSFISQAVNELHNGLYDIGDPYEFILNERGKNRYIKALNVFDRVIQRSFNDNVLTPAISNLTIYDNGASQKGKGVDFSRNRFKYHLRKAFNEYGQDSYILLIDFSKYFDNILHNEVLYQFAPLMTEDEYNFLELTFHTFDIDVSYLSDEEYLCYRDTLFNSLDYCDIPKEYLTGEKIMRKSVGIGNQTSQATGIYYPHEIDNYCTIVKGFGLYGRYMDDTYIFGRTKEELLSLLEDIKIICKKLGIHINEKKTKIQKIIFPISYLKINYKISETGRIFEIVPNKSLKREKTRIVKFHKLYLDGIMPIIDILQCFLSWYGAYYKFDSKSKVRVVEQFFKDTFNIQPYEDLHEILHYLLKWDMEKRKDKDNLVTI